MIPGGLSPKLPSRWLAPQAETAGNGSGCFEVRASHARLNQLASNSRHRGGNEA